MLKNILVNYVGSEVLIDIIFNQEMNIQSCITKVHNGETVIELQNLIEEEQGIELKTVNITLLENY